MGFTFLSCLVLVLQSNAHGLCLLCFEPTQCNWNEALKASDHPCLHYLLPHSHIFPIFPLQCLPMAFSLTIPSSPFSSCTPEMGFGPRRACRLSPFLIFHQSWLSLGCWMPSFAAKQSRKPSEQLPGLVGAFCIGFLANSSRSHHFPSCFGANIQPCAMQSCQLIQSSSMKS